MKLNLILLSLILAVRALGALGGDSNAAVKFRPIPPCSPLVSAAKALQIPTDSIDPAVSTTNLNPGDSISALLTLFEKGGRRTQWLLFLQALGEASGEGAKPHGPMKLYSNRGSKLEFVSLLKSGSLRVLGPFVESDAKKKQPKMNDETDRFVLDEGFLALGFDQAAATILRIRESKGKGTFNFKSSPFSDAEIARGRELAEKVHLTDAEERSLAGGVPALISYFDILQHASGLEDIAMRVVARPSIWSIVRHVGVTASIYFRQEQIQKGTFEQVGMSNLKALAGEPSGSAGRPEFVYHVPLEMQLNNQPALNVTLFATAPRPPLLLCGGVVGLLAEKPGDKETYLTLRVISAKRSGKAMAK
jgi:hypothetical protein